LDNGLQVRETEATSSFGAKFRSLKCLFSWGQGHIGLL